jgi:predicted transcriptional regulator
MAETPIDSVILGLTAQIVSAHASNNELEAGALPLVIRTVMTPW